jgi:hypothetical protein
LSLRYTGTKSNQKDALFLGLRMTVVYVQNKRAAECGHKNYGTREQIFVFGNHLIFS